MTEVISVSQDSNCEEFLNRASDFLYKDEATNSLMLGLCEGMLKSIEKNETIFLRLLEGNKTFSAAVQTPPRNLIISYATNEFLKKLAEYLLVINAQLPGVVGPAKESEQFAQYWASLKKCKVRLGMSQRIYRIENVVFPKKVVGTFRVADTSEVEKVFEWIMAFSKESLSAAELQNESHWREFAERAVSKQSAHFWINQNVPVSVAFCSRPTKNGVSINGVYTPPKHRKNGYASCVVAHLSQKMLSAGKQFCVLYTDLINPTSNKIYQDIGYKSVSDSKHFIFE